MDKNYATNISGGKSVKGIALAEWWVPVRLIMTRA